MLDDPFALLNRCHKISKDVFERLSIYHDLLVKWQPKINLVGPDTLPDAWRRHFLDSLQLLNSIDDLENTIVDIGSGAGFPGMVLAVCGATNVHLIESDGKKISFLREAARVTSTKVSIHHCRVEEFKNLSPDIIVSRACESLDNLLSLSHFVSRENFCLFHKGKNYSKEVEEAKVHWAFDMNIIPSITDREGVILKLTHITKKGI